MFKGKTDFKDSVAKGISFNGATVYESLNLGICCDDDNNQMRWMNLTGLKIHGFLKPELKMDFKREFAPCVRGIKLENGKKDKKDLYSIKETFHVLKQAYNKLGRYEEEDLAYVEFKRAEAKYKISEVESSSTKIWKLLIYPFKKLFLDLMGGYGTNPFSIVGAMVLAISLFATLYTLFPNLIIDSDINKIATDPILKSVWHLVSGKLPFIDCTLVKRLASSLYYSGITFLTIGYGDVKPASLVGRTLAYLEGFCGLFLMSYLTIAFSRKVLR